MNKGELYLKNIIVPTILLLAVITGISVSIMGSLPLILIVLVFAIFQLIKYPDLLLIILVLFTSTIESLSIINVINTGYFNFRAWELLAIICWALVILRYKNLIQSVKSKYTWVIIILMIAMTFVFIRDLALEKLSFSLFSLYFLQNIVGGWGLFFLVRSIITKNNYRRFIICLCILGAITSLSTSIIEITRSSTLMMMFYPHMAASQSYGGYQIATNGRLTSPIGTGLVIITMALSIAFFIISQKKVERIFGLVIFSICGLGFIFAGYRSLILYFILLVISSFLLALWYGNLKVILRYFFIVIFFLFLLIIVNSIWINLRGFQITDFITRRFLGDWSLTYSDPVRNAQNNIALNMFLAEPFLGVNIGGLDTSVLGVANSDLNGMLAILYNYGIIGALPFLWLSFNSIKDAISTFWKLRISKSQNIIFSFALIMSFIGYMAASLAFSPFVKWPGPLALLIGIYSVIFETSID